MAEVDERIARLEHLLEAPDDAEVDPEAARHTLRLLRQLRAEMSYRD
jgi:hypothetical protein